MHAPQEVMDRFAHLPWDRQVMAAMISAVDDGVGAILAEVERLGLADEHLHLLHVGQRPLARDAQLAGRHPDPYYGGSAGKLKGHKFSLYDGGIRVPGIMHWPGVIPGGQVLDQPCASMDIFPTLLNAAGGDLSAYKLDGLDIMPYVTSHAPLPERDIFWELQGQTAVRRGRWKLVLDGVLVEDAPPEDAVHLSDIVADMGERVNLNSRQPEIAATLRAAAQSWRAGIEARWEDEFARLAQGYTTYVSERGT